MKINFSQDIVKAIPTYMGTNWQNLIKESTFCYTKMYIYSVINGKSLISQQLNFELNKLWNNLELDYTDLENIYILINTVEVGNIKYKKFKGGK